VVNPTINLPFGDSSKPPAYHQAAWCSNIGDGLLLGLLHNPCSEAFPDVYFPLSKMQYRCSSSPGWTTPRLEQRLKHDPFIDAHLNMPYIPGSFYVPCASQTSQANQSLAAYY